MKKILSALLAVFLLFSAMSAFADANVEVAAQRLAAFDLIYDSDRTATVNRACAVSSVVKLVTGNTDFSGVYQSVFTDVPADHEAAGEIYYAYSMGYASGVSESEFAPDAPVTLQQFSKFAVAALGYRIVAEAEGGYTGGGYTGVAGRLGLYDGVDIAVESPLSTGDMLLILDNMLDAHPLEQSYVSGEESWVKSDETLYEKLAGKYDLDFTEGVVQAVGARYLPPYAALEDGEIMINGVVYRCDESYAPSLLGKKVDVYYQQTSASKAPVIVSIYETDTNKEVTVLAADVEAMSGTSFTYAETDVKSKTVNISASSVLYNGSPIANGDVTAPSTGCVRLLDSDGNGSYEVVFIEEYESFVVDSISSSNHSLTFKNDAEFHGKSGFWFDFDNDDKEYIFIGITGFDDIAEGDVVSIMANADETLVTIYAPGTKESGTITEVSVSDNVLILDGESYSLYAPNADKIFSDFALGQSGTFLLNHMGEIVDGADDWGAGKLYGYITAVSSANGFSVPKIRIITDSVSEKRVEEEGDTEIISYAYQNTSETVYELADTVNVSLNGSQEQRLAASDITSSMLKRGAVSYKLNSDGKIRSLKIYTVPVKEAVESDYAFHFNGEVNSFGKHATLPAFLIGSTTKVICVPLNNSPSNDDYFEEVEITDESYYSVYPIAFDSEDQSVECAVLLTDMDSSTPKPIKSTTKVSIVGQVSSVLDDNGDRLYKLETLTETDVKHPFLIEGSSNEAIVSALSCGDLVRYTTKGTGEISNIQYLESISALTNDYFNDKAMSANEVIYGRADSIALNRLDDNLNERVDKLTVYYGTPDSYDGSSLLRKYNIPREDAPPVYIYNRRNGMIKSGSTADISAYDRVGNGASDIYMLVNENNPEVVVIITD